MKTRPYSEKFLRQRKLYTILPLIAVPFLTLFYWAVAIKGFSQIPKEETKSTGLLLTLPDGNPPEKELTKLGHYQKAASDSARILEAIRKDPYRSGEVPERGLAFSPAVENSQDNSADRPKPITRRKSSAGRSTQADAADEKIYHKLKELEVALEAPANPKPITKEEPESKPLEIEANPELIRLQAMMAEMQLPDENPLPVDPEMQQLNELLEKALDLQYPERMNERIQTQSETEKRKVFTVSNQPEENPVSFLAGEEEIDSVQSPSQLAVYETGFYSLDDEESDYREQNAVSVVVDGTQTLVSGSTIRLRLTDPVYVAGVLIPEGTFLYGNVSLGNERLAVQINTIRHQGSLLPVKLQAYDLDGIPGLYIPGAIGRDAAKQSLSQNIQGVNLGAFNSSIGAQVADAGIYAAKTFLGRKTRLQQVTVKEGYRLLLKDGHDRS